MILSKSASVYSGVTPSTLPTASTRSTSNPTILPLGSLNSLGEYGILTPTMILPDEAIFSGRVAAIASTLSTSTATVSPPDGDPPPSVLLAHPASSRALPPASAQMVRATRPRAKTDRPDTGMSSQKIVVHRASYGVGEL